jgi:hypothetical protein
MILDIDYIVDETSKDKNINLDILKSIQRTVFKEISDWTKNPTSLKIYLSDVGSWYFKKAKTEDKLELFKKLSTHNYQNYEYNYERIDRKIKNYKFILSEYEKYTQDKLEIKYKKYGKEAYEAYCLDKKQKKIQKSKEDKSL